MLWVALLTPHFNMYSSLFITKKEVFKGFGRSLKGEETLVWIHACYLMGGVLREVLRIFFRVNECPLIHYGIFFTTLLSFQFL